MSGIALTKVLAKFVRDALKFVVRVHGANVFPIFAISSDAKPITLEQTLRAEDEL